MNIELLKMPVLILSIAVFNKQGLFQQPERSGKIFQTWKNLVLIGCLSNH
jgi:hypothetical protein